MKYAYYACSIACSVICLMLYSAWGNAGTTTQGLEQQVSPDERQRMHQDLDDYANKTYPERLEERRRKIQDRFNQADLNDDNVISREEAEQTMPGLARHFDEIDTDNDGTISREELQAAEDKRREEKARKLKEAKETKDQQLAREEPEQDVASTAKKKHISKHRTKPIPEDSKPAEDNSEGS